MFHDHKLINWTKLYVAIIERAIESGSKAQKAWARLSGTERGRVLNRAASIIRERNYDLSVLETYDTGKPISETLYADAKAQRMH